MSQPTTLELRPEDYEPATPMLPPVQDSTYYERTPSIAKLLGALAGAWGKMQDVITTKKVNAGAIRYSYATLADVLAMARPILSAQKLAVTQSAVTEGREVAVYTTIFHESGEYVTYKPLRFSMGGSPQNTGSAISYARRYSLMSILGLATEDDDGAAGGRKGSDSPRGSMLANIGALRNANETARENFDRFLKDNGVKVVTELDDEKLKALNKAMEDLRWF